MADISERMIKYYSKNDRNVIINAAQGHFATSHSHINYYIDVTRIKIRSSEGIEAARSIRAKMAHHVTNCDTIVCLDSTDVMGGYLAEELNKGDFALNNVHDAVYVVEPEENSIHQFMFRENVKPAIQGKDILVLVDTMTTGETMHRAIECIEYYGGRVAGVASIFATQELLDDKYKVFSLFTAEDLPGYASYHPTECPYCEKGIPIEAMVNGFGYSKLM